MSELVLQRYNYAETETEGRLWLNDDDYLYTLERPWVAGEPGGVPFESCVPNGTYELVPHSRPNGHEVYALRNHSLRVYYTQEDWRNAGRIGRYLILIHIGNYVDDVVGCIAPGLSRTIYNNRRMVGSSTRAMSRIMAADWDSIVIESACGTEN